MPVIRYKRTVRSIAMSKHPKQNGLIVNKTGNIIYLNATNPKTGTETSHLEMQIPIENLQDVIDTLNNLK